jgi:hypothetical protein
LNKVAPFVDVNAIVPILEAAAEEIERLVPQSAHEEETT